MLHPFSLFPHTFRPYVLGLVVLILIIRAGMALFSRNKTANHLPPGTQRSYGLAGGAICPKCNRPFPLSMAGIKLGLGIKFARCENCGKWSVVRRASPDELRAAEAAELADAQAGGSINTKSDAEKLAELVDQSRFTDRS